MKRFLMESTSLRRFTTSCSLVFADPDILVVAASLEIVATKPQLEEEDGYELHVEEVCPAAFGKAAAALRPALLQEASKQSPPRVEVADVMGLHKLLVFESLSEWLERRDVADRIAVAFNKSIEGQELAPEQFMLDLAFLV